MATSLSLMGEHLSCPICLDIFKNPVVLKCSHSFCEDCLQKNWKEVVNRLCPVCRKECYSEEPCPSLALRSLCESIQKITENNQAEHYCQLHEEKLKLFCFDDKQPICVVCHTSKKHKGHECNPIEEIVPGLKNKIQAMISSSVNKLQNEKITHQNWSEHIKGQFQCAEEQIREEFNKLHQFLEEEETAKIGALREEQEQKDEVMQERAEALTRETETLAETTVVVNKEMDVDNITFLQNYKTIMNRANCVSTDTEDIETVSGVLVDMANHLGSLKFKVWEKMLEIIDYIPVTLDPNTTSFMLAVADDLRTLKYSNWQNYPNNTERFQKNVGVLGSEGFSEGIHFWDVEVGDNSNWTLGVAKESISRKSLVKIEPESGLWVFRYVNGEYKAGKKKVKMNSQCPKVIRVQLNSDKRELSFIELPSKTTLHTFKNVFPGKVFP